MRLSVFTFAAACLALFATHAPAQAQGNLTLADCNGSECRCVLSNHTLEEWEVILDSDAPAGTVGIIIRDGGDHEWSSLTPEEIEVALGGDAQCDTELFQDWFPEDGTWDVRTALSDVGGAAECRALAPMMVSMMNQGDGPVTVEWGRVFDMETFYLASNPGPEDDRPVWTQVDFRTATGVGGGDGVSVDYRADLLSPVRFVIDTRISGEGCVFSLRSTVRKIG